MILIEGNLFFSQLLEEVGRGILHFVDVRRVVLPAVGVDNEFLYELDR